MSFTFCSSYAIIRKAGLNANVNIIASSQALAEWCDMAEGEICMETRRDWLTNYSSLASPIKTALGEAASNFAAMHVIDYDPSGYSSLSEASTLLDVLLDKYKTALNTLKDFKSNDLKDPS